jgi:hypothetical protein
VRITPRTDEVHLFSARTGLRLPEEEAPVVKPRAEGPSVSV